MSNFGQNDWESALNDEVIGQILDQIFGINQEEPYNLQGQPLPQQSFFNGINQEEPYNLQGQPLPQQSFFDGIKQEEPYNLQGQPLPQQSFFDGINQEEPYNLQGQLLPPQSFFDGINQEEPYNLQGQPLPQQNFFDYPLAQLNRNVTHIELGLTQLSNNPPNSNYQNGSSSVALRRRRKPRKTWSVEEHKLFLVGFHMYDASWKKISEEIIRTKTPSQLASHAQKYFIRQSMLPSQRERGSIHDITLQVLNRVIPTNVHPPVQDFIMQDIQPQQPN